MNLKDACFLEGSYDKPRNYIKKQKWHLVDKGPYTSSMVFPVVMYGCESWTIKKAEHQRTVASKLCLQKILETLLNCKEIKPVHPEGNQPWIFIGKTDVETEGPILWPPDVKSWLWKRPWCWERLKAKGELGFRGSKGEITSLTQWTWIWGNSGW